MPKYELMRRTGYFSLWRVPMRAFGVSFLLLFGLPFISSQAIGQISQGWREGWWWWCMVLVMPPTYVSFLFCLRGRYGVMIEGRGGGRGWLSLRCGHHHRLSVCLSTAIHSLSKNRYLFFFLGVSTTRYELLYKTHRSGTRSSIGVQVNTSLPPRRCFLPCATTTKPIPRIFFFTQRLLFS